MGRYLNQARQRFEKIEYYHKHAGTAGYSQAVFYWGKLSDIYARAARSKSGQSDATVIRILVEDADKLMKEMKSREKDAPSGQG